MTDPLVPARLALRHDGTPFSPLYGDVYHSAAGAFAQAQHVFLAGNGLPARWRGQRLFTILETGFGLGCNFLATWAAWRADAGRNERLAFVSIEKHPFSRDDLRTLHANLVADTTIAPLAAQLVDAWPMLVHGLHRLEFEGGRISLTIAFGDALQILPKLWLRADALYLDGFAPDRNPDLWSAPVFKGLARVAADRATLATYTCAGDVRRGLEAAGFACQKAPGFAGKREMLTGVFAPRWRVRRHEPPAPLSCVERHAIVIGAGLAGAALIDRLASRGWRISVIERHGRAAQEASGNPAGVFHPLLSRDNSMASRITRAGFLHALRRWDALERAGHDFARSRCGLLQLPADSDEAAALSNAIARHGYPDDLVRPLSAAQASALAGVSLLRDGWHFPLGGSLSPAALSAALCASAGGALEWLGATHAAHIERQGDSWVVHDETGRTIAQAPVVIMANANGAARLAGLRHALTRIVRGQVTRLPPSLVTGLRVPLIADGYAIPLAGGLLTGATYELDETDDAVRAAAHRDNLTRLASLLPPLADALRECDATSLTGRVGFRCVTSDRLPMVGALADEHRCGLLAQQLRGARLPDLPRSEGLYGMFALGSRGLVWASLAADIVVSQLEGEPCPIERDLAESLDPARYALRALRHDGWHDGPAS